MLYHAHTIKKGKGAENNHLQIRSEMFRLLQLNPLQWQTLKVDL